MANDTKMTTKNASRTARYPLPKSWEKAATVYCNISARNSKSTQSAHGSNGIGGKNPPMTLDANILIAYLGGDEAVQSRLSLWRE